MRRFHGIPKARLMSKARSLACHHHRQTALVHLTPSSSPQSLGQRHELLEVRLDLLVHRCMLNALGNEEEREVRHAFRGPLRRSKVCLPAPKKREARRGSAGRGSGAEEQEGKRPVRPRGLLRPPRSEPSYQDYDGGCRTEAGTGTRLINRQLRIRASKGTRPIHARLQAKAMSNAMRLEVSDRSREH